MKILFGRGSTGSVDEQGINGCTYYRIAQPAEYLEKQYGHECVITNLLSTANEEQLWQFETSDVIVLQRQNSAASMAYILYVTRQYPDKLYVFEVDDNVDELPEENICYEEFEGLDNRYRHKEFGKGAKRNVDLITTSTKTLKDYNKEFSNNVIVLPNCIDVANYPKRKKRKAPKDEVRILWFGSQTHKYDLQMMEEAIRKVALENRNVKIVTIGPYNFEGVHETQQEQHNIWIKFEEFHDFMAGLDIDIGLAPLLDTEFNRSKSNIKYLEYSALEIPTIASKVAPYTETITSGKDGFLVGPDFMDWYNKLTGLVNDERMRKTMGKNARQLVVDKYDIANNVSKWHNAYTQNLKRKLKSLS